MTHSPEVHKRRYSGLRLRSHFTQQGLEIENLARKTLSEIGGLAVELQRLPALIEDTYRGMDELTFWCHAIRSGEVIICREHERAMPMGVVLISNVKIGTCAELNFLLGGPLALDAALDVIVYAFKPAPEGLGCLKLKMLLHPQNTQALQLAQSLGFQPHGVLPCEASFHSQPTSMLLVELLNPATFSTGEDLVNGDTTRTSGSSGASRQTNGDESGPVRQHVRGGADSAMDVDNGDDPEQPDAGWLDRDRENAELLRSFNMGGAGVSGATGRPAGHDEPECQPAEDGAGEPDSVPDDSGSTPGRRPTPRKSKAKRRR